MAKLNVRNHWIRVEAEDESEDLFRIVFNDGFQVCVSMEDGDIECTIFAPDGQSKISDLYVRIAGDFAADFDQLQKAVETNSTHPKRFPALDEGLLRARSE